MSKNHFSFSLLKVVALFLLLFTQLDVFAQAPKGPFMGMQPTDMPKLLAPELLATALTEYNGTFSPDGTEFYYTSETHGSSAITFTRMKEDGSWTKPVVAPFSGIFVDYDPLFAPDGRSLFFSSERPPNEKEIDETTRIWYVLREGDGWSEPAYIYLTDKGDYHSSLTEDSIIYFNVWRTGDIYKAKPGLGEFEVERLPDAINDTGTDVGDPFISVNEDYLIFRGWADTYGMGDLYISFNIKGEWTKPQNLGPRINSEAHEMCPFVTKDGKYFIWSSRRKVRHYVWEPGATVDEVLEKSASADNGLGNIYYISADFIGKMRKEYLKKNR